MALRTTLARRLFSLKQADSAAPVTHSPATVEKYLAPQNASRLSFHRELITPPDGTVGAFFQRFLHKKAAVQATRLPDFVSTPDGDGLRKKLWPVNISGDRIRLDGLVPPPPVTVPKDGIGEISINDVKKILRCSQMEKVRSRVRNIPVNCVSYLEFVNICGGGCGNTEQALEYAKMMDESGSVIVLGDVVLLHPHKVAKSMEKIISETNAPPNDPRRKQLERMEHEKRMIDQKAQSLVKGELYCGLGYLAVQTLGFIRLTFWELSWDVMEPICFFVTSFHFGLAYTFFLRTSKEPSFEGYFQRRFKTKQEKLMKMYNFDVEKYNMLKKSFYHMDNHHLTGGGALPG
ncbi:unnamed protein product [Cuscuta europaea]|uniref:Calcium uniporter protein C-terminal domain-containing protein n=1 Tax=Cuscuta europaea TaxID=41803 RepID=A0A9P0YWY4_CUSEU|nr:unnamed protein product [Cuscuta europaea]